MIMIRLFIKLSFLISLTVGVKQADFGNAFSILPSSNDWFPLIKNADAIEIKKIVKIYMQPFREFQKAARNHEISAKQLKASFVAATSLMLESAKNFSIPSNDYESAKKDIKSYMVMSSAAFNMKEAEKLSPVFKVETLEAFSRLRLKHLLGGESSSYISFLMRHNSYQSTLQEWNIIGSRLPRCDFRSLMVRNVDLSYVEHMVALYLDVMRLRGKVNLASKLPTGLKFIATIRKDEVVRKIEALGNGYSTSTPPYSGFLISVCTIYAALLMVIF